MEYTQKVIYQSNNWYNDGLKRAKQRDLSGAVVSLKKSLQFNRENIAARNLLGLVYYGRGEVGEAVVEWILSKNIQPKENIAGYYLKKFQENPKEMDNVKQAVSKYNRALDSCIRGGKDFAMIQLQEAVEEFPGFLKAHQLLALLCISYGRYAEAKKSLKEAKKIDQSDELTIHYIQLLKEEMGSVPSGEKGKRKKRKRTISYNVGNETIIQPAPSIVKDHTGFMTMLNIFIGLIVGVAVMGFLILPEVRRETHAKNNKQITEFSDLISTQEAQISAMKKELEGYRASSEEKAGEENTAEATRDSYEVLMDVYGHYVAGDMNRSDMASKVVTINSDLLGSAAKEKYDKLWTDVCERRSAELYSGAKENYSAENYARVVDGLTELMKIDPNYDEGNAMNLLKKSYEAVGDEENAGIWAAQLEKSYPDLVASEEENSEDQSTENQDTENQNTEEQ